MANPEHLEILKQGVEKWNEWRKRNPDVIPDLKEADLVMAILCEIDLKRVNLSDADLSFADLSKADLRGANLSDADLSGANLSNANLIGADLTGADLSSAILSDADLGGADLTGANLSDADFSRAVLYETNLSETDLSGANLSDANLSDANLWIAYCSEANLSRVNLNAAKLIDTILDGAILTGACLWETQRAGWSINGVICEYVYWGNVQFDGFDETFKDDVTKSFYGPGEFERLFADKTKIRLFFKDGFDPLEFDTLPALIKHLENSHPGIRLRMVGIKENSGGIVVELAIEDVGEYSLEQLKQLRVEIETTAQRAIEYERKFLAEEKIREQVEARLDELRVLFREQMRLLSIANQTIVKGDNIVGDKYNVPGQAGAVGQNAHASDMTFNQIVNHFEKSIDLRALATQLGELREEMATRQDSSPQAVIAQCEAEKAEIAAQAGETSKVMEHLKAAGGWTLDFAKEVGKDVVVAAIKASMGMQ